MSIIVKIWVVALLLLWGKSAIAATYLPQSSNRVTINLDTGWLFNKVDNASYSGGTVFNDANWEKVCLPHSNIINKHAYLDTSAYKIITWYRRHFTPPASYSNRTFRIEFEGVATVATVYVNGESVGVPHKGGYTPFTIDITGKVKPGQDNVIAVKVDAKRHAEIPPEGRANLDFLLFGGIVRNVNMIVTDPLYVDWTFVATQNPSQTAPTNPTVTAKTKLVNGSSAQKICTVVTSIVDGNNSVVATASSQATVPARGDATITQITSAIANPQLWGIDNPYLYKVYIQVVEGANYLDEYTTRMGIRSLTVNKTDGKCYINGKAIKLRGLNRHETYPYIGRAAPRRLQRRDADILKYDLGCNMVRTAHYSQAPDFLDRCDEVGMLVLEEIPGWQALGTGEWRDLQMKNMVDMVMRDRNHPCILTWGCRVNETLDDEWYKSTNDTTRALDPTRLTSGVRFSNGVDPAYFYEDIWTQNFSVPAEKALHMPFLTTEFTGHNIKPSAHSWADDVTLINQIMNSSRGHAMGHDASYASSIWAGLLGWCAFDYNSQHANSTTIDSGRNFMAFVSPHGVSSNFRLPKLAAYFYQSQRDPALYGPMVHICNYHTPASPTTVLVVSNCEQVALYQDGTLISKQAPNVYTNLPHPCFHWIGVPTSPGELKAVGYIGGVEVASHVVRTPGNPAKLTLVPDTTVIYNGGDMTQVVASLFDASGQLLHLRADSITLSASGAGDFVGEAKTALEGGQMAFYVKTRSSETGSILCQASCAGFSASTTVTVTRDPQYITETQPTRILKSGMVKSNQGYHTFFGDRFAIPSSAGKDASLLVFDCSGKLVYKGGSTGRLIDLKKLGIARGVHIVHVTPKLENGASW